MYPFGPFGNMMPYSNFHGMNLDWVIQIAKDFLDQYTHIQETIDQGLEDLDEKATALQALLDEWYTTHSEDIAQELAQALDDINTALTGAISDFNTAAEAKAATTLASIPDDYTTLANTVAKHTTQLTRDVLGYNVVMDVNTTTHVASITGGRVTSNGKLYTIPSGETVTLPQDDSTHWLIGTYGEGNQLTFSLEDTTYVFTDADVFLGYSYNDIITGIPGFHLLHDSIPYHFDWDTWTEVDQYGIRGLTGPERMIIFDLDQHVIKIPAGTVGLTGKYNIGETTAQTIDISAITARYISLIYDFTANTFSAVTTTFNRNKYMLVGMIDQNVNYVFCRFPYTVITNPAKYYNVKPEIVIYGDSIVAGAGGLGFENIVAAFSGIRMLNRGIGSTGYITRVEANTSHLKGNNTPAAGSNQLITTSLNNVEDLITADIENITQNVVCMMAGTNDFGTYTNAQILTALAGCCDTILDAGKIPVVISPIRRYNKDMSSMVEAIEDYCNTNGIPFINVYNCGINPENSANKTKYITDGIHPTDAGYYLLAANIAQGLKKICMIDKFF